MSFSLTVLTKEQKVVFAEVKEFILSQRSGSAPENGRLSFVNDFPARDRTFLMKLSTDLNLVARWDEYDDDDRPLVTLYLPGHDEDDEDDDPSDDDDPEADAAVDRVLKKYEKADVVDRTDADAFEQREQQRLEERMKDWKSTYYRVRLIPQPGNAC